MIEVDLFWSFAIGASIACNAGHALEATSNFYSNKYFAYTLAFLSCVFAPSGVYLLSAFPGWESMFLLNRKIINKYPILMTLFSSSNCAVGVLGFYSAYNSIKNGKLTEANKFWLYPYLIMFAILGLGYDRFTFGGTYEQFHEIDDDDDQHKKKKPYSFKSFLSSDVCKTLILMGFVVGPGLSYPVRKWTKLNAKELELKRQLVKSTVSKTVAFITLFYIFYIHLRYKKEERKHFSDKRLKFAGNYAPLAGYYFVMLTLFAPILIPTFRMKSRA